MSLILRPPWTLQPPLGTRVRSDLDLRAVVLPGQAAYDVASGLYLSSSSGTLARTVVGGLGPALSATANQSAVYTTATARQRLEEGSIIWVGSLLGSASIAACLGGLTHNNTNALPYTQLEIKRRPEWADTILLSYSYSSTQYAVLVSSQTWATGRLVIIGTRKSGDTRLYIRDLDTGSIYTYSDTQSGTIDSAATARIEVGDSLNVRNPNAACALLAVAGTAWTDTQAHAIAQNPWQLFEPRRIWVPVSAGSGTQTLTPDLFTNSNTFYTHTVTTGAVTLTPDLFTNTNSFYTPTVSSSYTVTPNLFTNTNTFYTPVVTNLSTLYPDLFTNSQTFYTHVVTGGGGQTLEPELFSNSATFYGPTITVGSVTLTASLFTNTNDIYSHTVTSNYPLTPDLFSNSSSFYTPTISVGAVTLTPSLFTNSSTFYTHTISNSSTTIYFWKRTA